MERRAAKEGQQEGQAQGGLAAGDSLQAAPGAAWWTADKAVRAGAGAAAGKQARGWCVLVRARQGWRGSGGGAEACMLLPPPSSHL